MMRPFTVEQPRAARSTKRYRRHGVEGSRRRWGRERAPMRGPAVPDWGVRGNCHSPPPSTGPRVLNRTQGLGVPSVPVMHHSMTRHPVTRHRVTCHSVTCHPVTCHPVTCRAYLIVVIGQRGAITSAGVGGGRHPWELLARPTRSLRASRRLACASSSP
jgi:hypothetical protein